MEDFWSEVATIPEVSLNNGATAIKQMPARQMH